MNYLSENKKNSIKNLNYCEIFLFYAHYDVEKNKCVGRNKHVGRIFLGILIIVQSLIRACRKEKSEKINKRAARLLGTLEQVILIMTHNRGGTMSLRLSSFSSHNQVEWQAGATRGLFSVLKCLPSSRYVFQVWGNTFRPLDFFSNQESGRLCDLSY